MIRIARLTGATLAGAMPDVAALRIAVFRDWPYLYDGDAAYEERYLETYRQSEDAILVGAYEGERLVGAATGTPMEDHARDFAAAFDGQGITLNDIFYCAESVLLPAYRGQGIGHLFFDMREDHARALGRRHCVFCGVVRPADHPLRPAGYRPLDAFWRKRATRRSRARSLRSAGRILIGAKRPTTRCDSGYMRSEIYGISATFQKIAEVPLANGHMPLLVTTCRGATNQERA